MKKFKAKTAFFVISLALALLQDGRALGFEAKYKNVPNGVRYTTSVQMSPSTSRTKEEELLKKVLPRVSFDCFGKTGYFADSEFQCEVFHYCKSNGVRSTFHCPPNSIFNQLTMLCEAKTDSNKKLCNEGSITTNANSWTPLKFSAPTVPSNFTTNDTSRHASIDVHKNSTEKSVLGFQKLMLSMLKGENQNITGMLQSNPSVVSGPNLKAKSHNATLNADQLTPETTSVASSDEFKAGDKVFGKVIARNRTAISGSSAGHTARNVNPSIPSEKQPRHHRRKGRVMDLEPSESETIAKHHNEDAVPETHVDVATTTESSQITLTTFNATDSRPQDLFSVASNRTRSREKRRRRRNHRRRKNKFIDTTSNSPVLEENSETGGTMNNNETDIIQILRRKSLMSEKESSREGGSWQGMINPQDKKRKSYKVQSNMDINHFNNSNASDSNRNPYFRKTNNNNHAFTFGNRKPNNDENEDNMEYGDNEGTMGPTDFFADHELLNFSEEWSEEESPHLVVNPEKSTNRKKKRKSSSKQGNKKLPPNSESSWVNTSQEDFKDPGIFSETTFRPSETPLLDHHKFGYDLDIGEDEFRSKVPYKGQYYPDIKELADLEKNRWKISDHKDKNSKINVGDSLDNTQEKVKPTFLMNAESMQKSIQAMNAIKTSVKQLPKHTSAHQHLSKLMNEFFTMSTQHPRGVSMKSVQTGANIHIPKYRIPDEDIYKADAMAEPVENLPREVLDVVEFIAEQQAMKKEEDKPEDNGRQIIKLNTPAREKSIFPEELQKLFPDKKIRQLQPSREKMQDAIKQLFFPLEENGNSDEDDEDEQDFKEIAELAAFTSERIEPLLKTVLANEKSVHVVHQNHKRPKQNVSPSPLQESVPVRIIYRKNLVQPKPTTQSLVLPPPKKSNFKVIRARLPRPNLQIIHNNQMVSSPNSHFLVFRPPSVAPPHPPPLMPPHPLPSLVGYSNIPTIRPLMRSPFQFRSRRRKRALSNRLKRQVSYNPNNNPFYNPYFKTFSPNFTPHYRQFSNLFGSPSSTLLNTAGTHTFPFTFPTVRAPKLQRPLHQKFIPPRQPLRQSHQTSHQTMVVNDAPFPVHMGVQPHLIPQNSQLRSSRPVQPFHPPVHHSSTRVRRPPHVHQPPLMNSNFLKPIPIKSNVLAAPFPLNFQTSQPHPLPPIPNSRPPFTNMQLPNVHSRAPVHNLKPTPLKLPSPSVNFADHILPLALPISRAPQKQHQKSNGHAKPLLYSPYNPVKPLPHAIRNQLIGHLNSFPGMERPQMESKNPINPYTPNYPGLLMHSGYKPPKTQKPIIKPYNNTNKSNYPKKLHTSHSEHPTGYLEVTYKKNIVKTTPKPTRSYVRHSVPPPVKIKQKPFGMPQVRKPLPPKSHDNSNLRPIPIYPHTNLQPVPAALPYQEIKPKRKKPSRRRRPRPRPSAPFSPPPRPQVLVSPTPPPPQQIPAPPAEFTPKPFHQSKDAFNSIHPIKVEAQPANNKQQNLFPPAGYYGRDQLGQFFENIKKNEQKAMTTLSNHPADKSSSDSSSLSTASSSKEDFEIDQSGNQPVFGARIRSKSHRKSTSDSPRPSPTQRKETRLRQNFQESPHDNPIAPAPVNTYSEPSRPKPQPQPPSRSKPQPQPPSRSKPPPQPPRRRKPTRPQRPPEKNGNDSENIPAEIVYPKPVTQSPDFFNVPGGLGNIVDPSAQLQPGGNVPRDMFGIPIPFAEQNIFSSLRPADPNHRDFFSVPDHVAKQQLASLQKERPHSFLAPTEGPPKRPLESPSSRPKSEGRPKRRKRIKVKGRPKVSQSTPRTTTSSPESFTSEPELRGSSGGSMSVDKTTPTSTTRVHSKPTSASRYVSERRYTENNRKANLPPTLQEVSKSLLEGKLDIRKLNATISTSVSVSAGNKGQGTGHEPRKVFSSKNGGLAVSKNGPRQRKRFRPSKISVSESKDDISSTENAIKSDEKLQIASSVIDIIKATAESEKKQTTTDPSMQFSSTRLSKTWVVKSSDEDISGRSI